MTSPEAPSSLLQASLPGQEVLDFYYLLDPEERLQLGYRAHCLVHHVAKTAPQIIFFLDKSGRPLQYLFRSIWPWCQARGEVHHDQYPDQTGFLHIGRDHHTGEPPWQLLSSEDLPKLAAYYQRMLGAEPQRILIVDELLGKGNTMNFAHKVVAKMFPRASLDGFYFQDSTGTIELFRKPMGQAAAWRLMLDDHLAYGLTGVSDINANFRKEFRDILAHRAVLRCDWREQLWAMEYECLLNFAIKRRLVGSHLPDLLAEVSEVLEGIPNSTPAKRGIAYARRIEQALENGLPPMPPRREEGIDINNAMEDLRSVTHDDIVSLRVAGCYWNKLRLMVIKVMALRPELTERLLPLASGLEGQGMIIDSLVHWASEWDIAQRFSEQESLTLPNEIARLRRELAGCVFLYAHYYQSGYAALE